LIEERPVFTACHAILNVELASVGILNVTVGVVVSTIKIVVA
jgi:hypothetical protein